MFVIVRSIVDVFPLADQVGESRLLCTVRLLSSMMSSSCLPLLFVDLFPHLVLWAFESVQRMTPCFDWLAFVISSRNFPSFILSSYGMYDEHMKSRLFWFVGSLIDIVHVSRSENSSWGRQFCCRIFDACMIARGVLLSIIV